MRHIPFMGLLTISALLTSSPLNATPAFDWSYRFGGPGINTSYDVAVDGSGNVVIAGTFTGTMNLGGGPLASAGSWDIFLAKFDASGAHQWSQRFGGAGLDGAQAVTVDAAGNITMTGYFRGPVGFGGAPLVGNAGLDIFVARFDGAGLHKWSRWYGSASADEGQDIVADALGNVIVTGNYGGPINFSGIAGTPAFGSLDVFLLKLDAAGVYQWSKGFGGIGIDAGYGVAVDASNSILLTGEFHNGVNFGGVPLISAGLSDVFVAKYGADGTHQWSTRLGGPNDDEGQGVGADASGGVVVTGIYNGACVAKYDATGVPQWSQSFSGSDMVQGLDLAVSPAGNIAITGNLRGTTDFGGGPLTSAGDDDIFVATYEATGAHRWSQRFGNTGDDWGYGSAFDPSGDLIATGIFTGSVDFGGGSLVSAGLADVYLVKFDDFTPDATPPVISCPADVQVEQAGPGGTPATDPVVAAFLAGASTSDDVDPAPVITSDAPAIFPAGTTPVTFSAMDASGNHAECTATVSVIDATPPGITCPANVQVEQTAPGGTPATHPVVAAFLAGASASDEVDPAPVITSDAPAIFPAGTTPVTFSVMDASGNHAECTATVSVFARTPRRIAVVLDKDVLWPPNHKFVMVCAEVTVDNGDAESAISLVSITSDESANARGDGNTGADIRDASFGTPDRCFELRAERAGNGDGRVYEIVYCASDGSGNAVYDTALVRVPHDMSSNLGESQSAALTSVYPNPFNPQTTVEYSLLADDRVRIVIYDARGAVVRSLVDQPMPAGEHRVRWNGVDQAGRPVGSGIYFVKMAAGSSVETRKIVLLK